MYHLSYSGQFCALDQETKLESEFAKFKVLTELQELATTINHIYINNESLMVITNINNEIQCLHL